MRRAVGYVPIIRLRQDGDNTGTTPTDGTDPNAPPDTGDGSGDGSNPGDGSGGTDTPTDPTPTDPPADPPTSTTTTTTTTKSSRSSSTSTSKTTKSTSTTKPNDTPDQSTNLPNTNTNTNTDANTGSQTSGSPSATDHSVAPAGPSSTTPIPPVQPAGSGTQIVDVPSNSFDGALSGGTENGQFATNTSVPTSAAAKSSGSSKVLPILLPCLVIPIALVAVLILVIRRRRQQHAALLDDFTKRSTFYSGAGFGIGAEAEKNTVPMSSTAHLNRSPSLSSSRHGAAYGAPHSPSGAGSHLDHSMPTINVNHMASYTNANPMFNVVPPTPRSAHNRTPSDDLDIKCAGRGVSTGSFSALYDEYGRDSRAGGEGADDTMLAYDRPASATASMPDHPYSPTSTAYQGQFQQQQQYAYQGSNQYPPQQQQYYNQYQYQYQPQPQPQPQPPVQAYLAPHPASAQYAPAQSSSFFKRPQFLGGAASQPASNNPFTRNVTPAQQHAHSNSASSTTQPAHKPSASQSTTSLTTGTTGAPQLQLPTFSFDLHNVSEASSPISALFRTEDPFADPTNGAGAARIDGSTSTAGYTGRAGESDAESVKASAFPSPPSRVSAERRAARTRSVEQRLMMAMALNETNGANLQ